MFTLFLFQTDAYAGVSSHGLKKVYCCLVFFFFFFFFCKTSDLARATYVPRGNGIISVVMAWMKGPLLHIADRDRSNQILTMVVRSGTI